MRIIESSVARRQPVASSLRASRDQYNAEQMTGLTAGPYAPKRGGAGTEEMPRASKFSEAADYSIQFSISRSCTRRNSSVLSVTSVSCRARACAASKRVVGADHRSTGFEIRTDLSVVKGGFIRKAFTSTCRRYSSRAARSCRRRGDIATPNSSSDFVITEMQSASIGSLQPSRNDADGRLHDYEDMSLSSTLP
jgi:hypothetical protein